MADPDVGILSDAIARNAAAVLSLPSAGMFRHHKTRFLAEAPEGFWVEAAAEERTLIEELIATCQPAGISFRGGIHRVAFLAPLLRRDPNFQINETTMVEGLLLAFPADLKAVQRRNYYRVNVRPESEVAVRVWRIPEHAYLKDRPLASQEIEAEIRNLSAGGVGLTLHPKDDELRHLGAGDRLRLLLAHRSEELIIEGRIRHAPKEAAGAIRIGVQFAKLEGNLEGRQALAKITSIIGELQRDEVRRTRLGMGD